MSDPNVPVPADPEPGPQADLLTALRKLESRLYGNDVVEQVKSLPADGKQAFVVSRLHFTAAVADLNAELLADIDRRLQGQDAALRQGIDDLSGSLDRLEEAAGWAAALDSVLGVLKQVVPLV